MGGPARTPSISSVPVSPTHLRVAVCECPPALVAGAAEWRGLCAAVARHRPDLLLLGELPFGRWIAAAPAFDAAAWRESCALHEEGLRRLGDLGAPIVAGTRPTLAGDRRVNEGFVWTSETGVQGVHTKQYFPDEAGFYEARWFEAGERHFRIAPVGPGWAGFLICTKLMFNEHARHYGRLGVQVLLVPRAVGAASLERWLVATRMAAIVAGSYVATSNRGGTDDRGQEFGGGWIIDPGGGLVARTTAQTPVVVHEIDLAWAERAQDEYPCYVPERPARA
jgi:N-carbamoylputrescine amidase